MLSKIRDLLYLLLFIIIKHLFKKIKKEIINYSFIYIECLFASQVFVVVYVMTL
jgi:hypothetical protein